MRMIPTVSRRLRRWALPAAVVAALALAVPAAPLASAAPARPPSRPTVVLVHGDWADGSSWNAVTARLTARGYRVVVPPNPLRGPLEDGTYLHSYLATIGGPIVLVAHSYGGFVITNAAVGVPNVRALVYIDAFVPDAGDLLFDLAPGSCLGGDPASTFDVVPLADGADLYLKTAPNGTYPGFLRCFANGVDRREAAILAATQRPAAARQAEEPSGAPAWTDIPSWSLIGLRDHVIPPAAQQFMSKRAGARISYADAGHLSPISHAPKVTQVIEAAAAATS